MRPSLPKCNFLGPPGPDGDEVAHLPDDWSGNSSGDPFAYLPEVYTLTEEETDLAARYRKGDLSGGYLRSQIACFRAPRPTAEHERRRAGLATVQEQARAGGVVLPESFLKLAECDEYVDRIRHNTIWFHLFPVLVDYPAAPDCKLLEIFHESQGCDHWSLLLIPDGSHVVVYHTESLDIETNYPTGGWRPRIESFEFLECATSFDQWLAVYFLDCIRGDQHYSEMLEKFPGM